MSQKKLKDLNTSTSPNDSDILLIEDTEATKNITFLDLFNKIKTKLGLGSLATKNKVAQSDMETAVSNLLNSIGKASDLTTTQKANLVAAINELVESTNSLNRNIETANSEINKRALTNVNSINFGYDNNNAFTIDFNLDGGRVAKLVIENTGLRYLYSDGSTWTTIWSK